MQKKEKHRNTKIKLHPRNKHRGQYDFDVLCACCPGLKEFVKVNEYGNRSIDFFNPEAVKMLNVALLKHFYGIGFWDIPTNYLTPPVPGRTDYIHYIADLLPESRGSENTSEKKIRGLDIGVGANCIYPLIGVAGYGWSFVGADTDEVAIRSAAKIVAANKVLTGKIELRLQKKKQHIFAGIIRKNEVFDFTICNPPFHASAEEARAGTARKLRNLKKENHAGVTLNFGGKSNELWCEGGEIQFITNMINESKQFRKSCLWFTTLVSKEVNLKKYYTILKSVGAARVKTIPMGQGNKISRILAWSFSNAG